jgi:hypothetical protein
VLVDQANSLLGTMHAFAHLGSFAASTELLQLRNRTTAVYTDAELVFNSTFILRGFS